MAGLLLDNIRLLGRNRVWAGGFRNTLQTRPVRVQAEALSESGKTVVRQVVADNVFHFAEIPVLANTFPHRGSTNPRLVRIKLPHVEVHEKRSID